MGLNRDYKNKEQKDKQVQQIGSNFVDYNTEATFNLKRNAVIRKQAPVVSRKQWPQRELWRSNQYDRISVRGIGKDCFPHHRV
jgi:hypothetical protein